MKRFIYWSEYYKMYLVRCNGNRIVFLFTLDKEVIMSELYKGDSESFDFVSNCYLDYAKEVICRRALPDLRDGQKKVTRRIIYSAYENKKPTMQKCIPFVSDAVKLHPHGDQAVYGAFTLLTDENGSCNMPFFEGLGNLGKVFMSKPPADMRYPKARVNKNMEIFFRDKEVMKLVAAEEGEGKEPEVLNAIYPVVLVNGTMGIAVSVAAKIPSFNLVDVLDLTIKYLEQGKLEVTDVIVPDFPTGGIIVRNDTELAKIMATGHGKVKIRAKVEVVGNQILVKEVPFEKTVESIENLIKKSGIKEISFATSTVGRNSSALLTIECKSKKVVDYVLKELYRRNILQSVFTSNIIVTEKEIPYLLGVHGIIKRWSNWRKGVVVEKFEKMLKVASDEIDLLKYLRVLINDVDTCVEYATVFVKEGKLAARNFLKGYLGEKFETVPESVIDWIMKRDLSSLSKKATSYLSRYDKLQKDMEDYNHYKSHPEEYIIEELSELKEEFKGTYERKTQITYNDYKFSKISDTDAIEDDSYCVWTLRRDGFLMKTREFQRNNLKPDSEGNDPILTEFEGNANSILIGFDNFGRILRVIGKEIPFTAYGENGVYLPKYFDCTFQEDYKVLYMGLLDGTKRMLVYRDGYIGYLDTSEYYGKKNIKVISKGVCNAVYDQLLEVYEEKDIPQMLMFADDTDGIVKVGIVNIDSVIERGRLSRAKIFEGTVNCPYLREFNGMEIYKYIEKPEQYMGKFKRLRTKIYGDPEELRDGKYLSLCKDFEE